MADLLSLIAPIFVLIGVGLAAVHWKFVSVQLVQTLGTFVLNFALPALILHALLQQDLRQTLNWNYVLAYAAGSVAVFAVVLAFFLVLLKKPLPHAAVAALGGSASNSGFVGFPIASLALGVPALTALPLSMLVENILIIPLALIIGESGLQEGQTPGKVIRQSLQRLSRTPLILAMVIGVALSALGISLPKPVSASIDMMADAAVPCALFVVGGTLAGLRVGSVMGDVSLIALGKLVLHPLAVGTAFMLIGGVPSDLMAAGIILASAPMLTIYPIIGARFGYDRTCAAALLVTTIASFVTLIVVLGLVVPEGAM